LKPSIALARNIEAARAAARLHRATNPRIIGSVLHDTDTDGSDLDLLVDVRPV
jgi:predicted nucleotidyltransferase